MMSAVVAHPRVSPRPTSFVRDTPARRLVAYLLVRIGHALTIAGIGVLPVEHPYRLMHGSAAELFRSRVDGLPRWGILSMYDPPL